MNTTSRHRIRTADERSTDAAPVQTVLHGSVSADDAAYARRKVAALAHYVREPIAFARVKLTELRNPAVRRGSIAQGNLDVAGRAVRAQIAASTMREAVDLLVDRLRVRLARVNEHWEARRGGMPKPAPREWRHGSEPTHRPDHYPRSVEDRQIIRRKSFAQRVESADEAAFEMESMDYDFHLFTDEATGADCVIYRAGPTGYRLARTTPGATPEPGPLAVPLTVSPVAAPNLSLPDAENRLEATGWPFVFFVDSETRRGSVLYHRYDGHYGLITSAEQSPGAAGPGA
ncbi:HPF/RaiA family ribosome-associated protein [Actinospica sp. MGRD01-02]|uniref:HPF/RaiA family ribosome-associated protein n=1 Tax=Actinospica acidithermotolerans TaxID=2828514 RepID=A0A941EC50_9ACTN|nr:HPF/RaiA family ribosome-associated protein [Actinospica acidithermotolerans]MBR7828811.1 HPF/RaiA family ribosome-associated protein [Actinospica acidithermotolerans]